MFKVTYAGHATVLVQVGSHRILTDPIFSNRIFHLYRQSAPVQQPEHFDPSLVLISHAHFDHLDLPSFAFIKTSVPIITPPDLSCLISKGYQNPVIELESGHETTLSDGVKIKALRLKHRGFRFSGFRYRQTHGYLISVEDLNFLFLGDSAYIPDLKKQLNGTKIDCAFLPIGAYSPRWFMKSRHMNPEEAVRLFEDIGARWMIPIHWGSFRLSLESVKAPIYWLKEICQKKKCADRIKIIEPGYSITL